MAKVNLGTKIENGGTTASGKVSAVEIMAIATSVDALYDALFEAGIIGVLKTAVLPDSTLSPDQFETLPNGQIGLIGFDNIGTGGGGNPKLPMPVITFGTSTASQNIVNWTASTGATSYTLECQIASVWTVLYTGALRNYTHGSLQPNTQYNYRVKATGDGFTDSNYGTGSKSTAVDSGAGAVAITQWPELEGFGLTGNNLDMVDAGSYNRARSQAYLPAGVNGYIQAQGYAQIGFASDPASMVTESGLAFGLFVNEANSKLRYRQAGSGTDAIELTIGAFDPIVRLRRAGTTFHVECSLDNGGSFTEYATFEDTVLTDLYVKAVEGNGRGGYLHNIVGVGLSINSGV